MGEHGTQSSTRTSYVGSEVDALFQEAEKLYKAAGFASMAQFGLVMKAIKTD